MRAPQPSLQRLFGLAAVPAQRGAAWQALDAALARLDPALAGPAQAARMDGLLQGATPGAGLVPLLDRLLGSAAAGQASVAGDSLQANSRAGLGRPGPAPPAGASLAGPVGDPSGLPVPRFLPQPRPARPPAAKPSAGMPWPMRPAGPSASAPALPSRLIAAARHQDGPPNSSTPTPTPASGGPMARQPFTAFAHAAGGPRTTAAAGAPSSRRPPSRSVVPAAPPGPPWPDATAARQGWQQRLDSAGLAAAWHATLHAAPPVQPQRPAAGPQAPTLAVAIAAPPWRGANAAAAADIAANIAANIAPDGAPAQASALAQRLAHTLDHLAAPPGRRRPAAAAPIAPTSASPEHSPNRLAALPRVGRIGGFKGLAAFGLPGAIGLPAALGLPAAGPASDATAGANQAAAPGWRQAQPRWPDPGLADDPQRLIDQVEAALREQAARNGISLDN